MGGSDLRGMFVLDGAARDWSFEASDLSFADFGNVDLSGSRFDEAQLTETRFNNVSLKDATFFKAKFEHPLLSIRPGQLPFAASLGSATGVTSFESFEGGTAALDELREELKKEGFKLQAQEVNYAINRYPSDQTFGGLRVVKYLLFGIAYAYGLKPARTLVTVLLLIPVFSFLYVLALIDTSPWSVASIWAIRTPPKNHSNRSMKPVRLRKRNCRFWLIALWFSVLSAFRIGWHDFNVGDWIARVQSSDYKLEATGWVRTISGSQSLVSLYLIVLAITSYFDL
jgi:hypothetical protein